MKLWLYWYAVTFGPVLLVSGLLIYNEARMSAKYRRENGNSQR